MYRVVSLFLLPCVLLTQSVSLGHSHGGNDPAGHDPRSHFHTNSTSAPRSHDHGHHNHSSDGHHHHDDGDDAPEPDTQPPSQPEPLSEHDSDVVFITSVDVFINARSAVDDELAASLLWAAAGLYLPTASGLIRCMRQRTGHTQWPPSDCSCLLYVRYLALLI